MRALRVAVEELDLAVAGEWMGDAPHRLDPISVAFQFEFANDARRHDGHHVGIGRYPNLWVIEKRGAGIGGAPNAVSRFEHEGARARAREIRAADEPIVPTTNDDRVISITRHVRL